MKLKTALHALLDLMAPHRCPGCDVEVQQEGFCEVCTPLLEPYLRGPAAFEYGGPMAEAINQLKYHGRTDYARPLGRLLAQAALRHIGRVDVVVPVPLHPKRRRQRGFNQVELLAASVAGALGVSVDRRLVCRVRPTPPQVGLSMRDRQLSVVGAFAVVPKRPVPARVLLIDDVTTTGATLGACADAIADAGAQIVRTLALASTPR